MKGILAIIGSVIVGLVVSQVASAHVYVSSNDKASGAILHITPDDDPVAGQQSMIYFDANSNAYGSKVADVRLESQNQSGEVTIVKTKTENGLSVARYTFPVQGIYNMRITTTASGGQRIFEYSQRVSRGVAGSVLDRPNHSWAEMVLITSGILLAIVIIVAVNRWHDILRQSKW